MDQRLDELRRIVAQRRRPEFNPSIAGMVAAIARTAKRDTQRLGAVAEAWLAIVPSTIVDRCRLESLERGVLSVVADDAATRFEIDRLLRSGLTARLQATTQGALSRVRVRVGAGDAEAAGDRMPAHGMADDRDVPPDRRRARGAKRR
ncbi:MAG: DciA family protein [Phycisphaerales bacterium]